MRIVCDNAHHDAGEGVCVFCVNDRIKKAVQEARLHAIRLVEAPIPGLLEMAQNLDQSGGDSSLWRTVAKSLQDAGQAIKDSGEFMDACEARKASPSS